MRGYGGNPWQAAANAYGSDLDQYGQIAMQGMNERANAPSRLYQAFMQSYQQALDRKIQEEELARRNRLADVQEQRADEQERRNRMLDRAKIAEYLSKNLTGDRGSFEQAESVVAGSGYESMLPKPTDSFKIEDASGDLLGTGLPVTPGAASPEKHYPVGSGVAQDREKSANKLKAEAQKFMFRDKWQSAKNDLTRAKQAWEQDPENPRNQQALAAAEANSARADEIMANLEAGIPEARASSYRASASAALTNANTGQRNAATAEGRLEWQKGKKPLSQNERAKWFGRLKGTFVEGPDKKPTPFDLLPEDAKLAVVERHAENYGGTGGSGKDPLIGTPTKYPDGTKLKDGRTVKVKDGKIVAVI